MNKLGSAMRQRLEYSVAAMKAHEGYYIWERFWGTPYAKE